MERTRYHPGQPAEPTSTHYQRYTVDRGLSTAQAVNFVVEGRDDALIDPAQCYLKSTFRVVNQDGSSLEDGAGVFLGPNYGLNLWSQVSLTLNNSHLPPGNDYAYTALLTELLGAAPVVRDGVQAPLAGWNSPVHNSSKITDAAAANPYTFDMYTSVGTLSKPVSVFHRIHSDFLQSCAQLLPNKMQLGITLTRAKDSFVLARSSTDEYKVEVLSVSLFVMRVQPSPSSLLRLNQSLARGGKLHYQRLHMIAFPCAQGSLTWTWHNCFNNVLPRRVFVALVAQESYFGSFDRISTYLESGGVRSVRFCQDGREILAEPYTSEFGYISPGVVKYEDCDAKSPYAGLCRSLGVFAAPRQHVGIPYADYVNGSTVWGVGLEHDQVESGALDIHMEFATPTHQPLMILVLGEYPKTLSFDASRNLL